MAREEQITQWLDIIAEDMSVAEEQRKFLTVIKQMNIEARYREIKSKLAANLNEEICQQILEQTKEMHLWILQKFLPEKKL